MFISEVESCVAISAGAAEARRRSVRSSKTFRFRAGDAGFTNGNSKFGPFQSQLFVGDQTQSLVMRVFLEKTSDGANYQGACFSFREGFDSGSRALEFADDASLFVSKIKAPTAARRSISRNRGSKK